MSKTYADPLKVPFGDLPPRLPSASVCSACQRPIREHRRVPKYGAVVEVSKGQWRRDPNAILYECPTR
jgi:hypothetical protein